MELQKVSIVIPIYNVEKYINRCVDSVINQTYKNLQIILVNDGSPDNCEKIVDEYAKQDSRIEVIHKENGGLSDARNFGVRKITGDFTLFVDSDDWLDKKMVETMVSTINKFNADIVQAAFYYAYKDHLLYDDRFYKEDSEPVIYNNNELMKELVINDKVKNFAWGKLYKTNLIKDISFKNGVIFEDIFWAHNVMSKVNKYVLMHKPLYYYYQRESSIVSTYTVKNLDILEAMQERHKFIENNYKFLQKYSYSLILKTSIIQYNLLSVKKNVDKNKVYRNYIKKYIYENYEELKKSIDKNDKDLKQQIILFRVFPLLNTLVIVKNRCLRKFGLKKNEKYLRRIEIKK